MMELNATTYAGQLQRSQRAIQKLCSIHRRICACSVACMPGQDLDQTSQEYVIEVVAAFPSVN